MTTPTVWCRWPVWTSVSPRLRTGSISANSLSEGNIEMKYWHITVHNTINSWAYNDMPWPLVLFIWRWYLCARKCPHALHPVSQRFPQCCLWNGSSIRLTDDGRGRSFQGRSFSFCSFHASLRRGDWRCNVFCFVPTCSVSSSSTLQNVKWL